MLVTFSRSRGESSPTRATRRLIAAVDRFRSSHTLHPLSFVICHFISRQLVRADSNFSPLFNDNASLMRLAGSIFYYAFH